jgi:hypothetical protein
MQDEFPELKAMADIATLFASLEEDEIQRVLRWATEKYRSKSGSGGTVIGGVSASGTGIVENPIGNERQPFADLPAIMDAAKPTNGLERILVAAYFNQVTRNEDGFDSQSVNTQLKHLGYPSANITRDMVRLVDRSPKYVIQTRKEGSTQQARKRFRLTTEGIRAVEAMLRKGQASNE